MWDPLSLSLLQRGGNPVHAEPLGGMTTKGGAAVISRLATTAGTVIFLIPIHEPRVETYVSRSDVCIHAQL